MFDLDLCDRIQAESFIRRGYATTMCRWITDRLQPGDLFVDVGANVGMVSFSAGVSGARVAAYEPDPGNCSRWRANALLNPTVAARLVEAAVGARVGVVSFRCGRESGWGRVGDGDLEIRQTTLDAEFPSERITLLKIDVEGYEAEVLDGARQLLTEQRVDAIVCELNDGFGSTAPIVERLHGFGYRREQISRLDGAFTRC